LFVFIFKKDKLQLNFTIHEKIDKTKAGKLSTDRIFLA